jgi:hypothetical protein
MLEQEKDIAPAGSYTRRQALEQHAAFQAKSDQIPHRKRPSWDVP